MAMSFSRPDPASPAQVADATFSTGRRGFDQDEVRDFLRMLSAELGRLHERERFLERELRQAQSQPELGASQLDDETLTRLLGEETARVLNAARESAHEIREKAEQAAARLLTEASDEAARRREEAETEASRRRADAANDAEAELSMAKQQGREMVNEARAYRERVLSELARRRELAREQIEQLIHGRDRLMQAFERARVVAVDVVAEMQPLGEPDEYVNLQPTTGPVPVMVAREQSAPVAEAVEAEQPEAANPPFDHARAGSDLHLVDTAVEQPEVVADPAEDDVEAAEADPDAETDVVGDEAEGTAVQVADTETTDDEHDSLDEVADESATDDGAVEVADDSAFETSNDSADTTTDTVDADDVETDTDDTDAAENAETAADSEESNADVSDADIDDEADIDHEADADPAAEHADVDDQRDDVVVDLFARLRHGAEQADESHDDDVAATDMDTADIAPDVDADGDDVAAADSVDQVDASDHTSSSSETAPFEQRDADLTPLIVGGARKLKRVLADEQNDVLDGLRRSDPVLSIDAFLPQVSAHAARYADALSDDFVLAANAGAQIASPGKTAKLPKADAKAATQHAAAMLSEWLVVPLRDRLARCVSEGEGDNGAITQKVRAVYREWKTQHIDEQLDDVMRAAHGRGVLAAIPAGTPTQWTPDPRHVAGPDCDDNALEGAVAAGEAFPTGHTFAPAHPGCRCMLLPAAP